MSDTQPLPLSIQPVISYPSVAKVGETYMMTIDLETSGGEWLYEEEEYPIDLMLETSPLFRCKAIGEPSLVLHRFGGTYGAAKFLLTAAQQGMQGKIRVTLVNKWGVTIRVLSLDEINVTQEETEILVPIGSYQTVTPVRQQSEKDSPNRYIGNPYILGRPIYEKDKFFGYESFFNFIADNLLQNVKVIVLFSARWIRNPSVIQQIPNFVQLDEFVFIQFDLQDKANLSISEILYNLAETITDTLNDKSILPQRELFREESIFSEVFLPRVYQKIENKNLVLLLDEFDVAVTESNYINNVERQTLSSY